MNVLDLHTILACLIKRIDIIIEDQLHGSQLKLDDSSNPFACERCCAP